MGEFAAGSRIDSDRKVCQENGSPDPLGRWIDEEGYVRLANGEADDGWRVDDDGRLYDGSGVQQDISLTVPSGWRVAIPPPVRMVQPGETLWTTEAGQQVVLSTTERRSPSAEALKAFQQGIPHMPARSADLSWVDQNFDPKATMRTRALGAEYVGEDKRSNAFRAHTGRALQPENDTSWTTLYGVSGDATMHKSVQESIPQVPKRHEEGFLVDSSGNKLNGTFGYVVHPDGTLYTFNRNEAFVTVNGEWKDITDSPQLAGMLLEAMKNGEQARQVYHSTAVSGQPVAGAGDIEVKDGKITKISNDSGHYQPEAEYLWQTIEWLAAQGMPVHNIDVRMVAATRDAEQVLAAWQLRVSRGNLAPLYAKNTAMSEFHKGLREQATAQLPPGDLRQTHLKATGCSNLQVTKSSRNNLYCSGCDEDLDETYLPLLAVRAHDDPGGA
jgi:hypothetical protein